MLLVISSLPSNIAAARSLLTGATVYPAACKTAAARNVPHSVHMTANSPQYADRTALAASDDPNDRLPDAGIIERP
jgi:hypothetical protein